MVIGGAVNTLALLFCAVFLLYVVVILVPFLRRKDGVRGDPADFEWHALVPCLDEEAVIAATIRRLRADHPRFHVWCIDDDSDDATARIIETMAEDDPHVHLVRRMRPAARAGKGEALNAGWRALRAWVTETGADPARAIVCVLDADARLDPDALAKVAGSSGFADPAVGAVQIQVRMINRGTDDIDGDRPAAPTRFGRLLVSLQDLEFRTVIAAMQHARHMLASAGMGGNGQFSRLTVLDQVAATATTPWHSALLEDFEFGLHVLLVGNKNRYCDEAWVAQEGLTDFNRLVTQRTRWAQGGMQCMRYFLQVVSNPNISAASAFEICYFLTVPWTQLTGTIVFLAAGVMTVYWAVATVGGVLGWLATGAGALLLFAFVFGVLPVAMWGIVYKYKCERRTTWGRTVVLALSHWVYSYAMLIAAWRAFFRFVRSRSEWTKTERVGSGVAPAVDAPGAP